MPTEVMRYLKSTRTEGIIYTAEADGEIVLRAYSDASWVDDRTNGRSTSGMLITLLGGPISWTSRQQPVVALSTAEAEFIAANEAGREVIWLRTLLAELNCPQHNPTELMVDNLSAVKMSNRKDAGKSDMRKHILAKYYWLREQVNTGTIAVTWLPTGQELADIFTKPLGPQLFNEFKPVIMGTAYDNPHFILKQ